MFKKAVFFLLVISLLIFLFSRWGEFYLDDSLFFYRYSYNLRTKGKICWNDVPSWGLTSLTYLGMVFPLYLLIPNYPRLVMVLSSSLSGILFLFFLFFFLFKEIKSRWKWELAIIISLFLNYAAPQMAYHFTSGLETMFSLFYFFMFLWASFKWEKGEFPDLLWAVWAVSLFYTRPELIVYPISYLILAFVFKDFSSNKNFKRLFFSFFIIFLLTEVIAYFYFGSFLPYPFWVKQQGFYKAIPPAYNYFNRAFLFSQFRNFFLKYFPLFLLNVFLILKSWSRVKKSSFFWSLWISTFVIYCYHFFFVYPIMGYSSRYLYPTIPALIFSIFYLISGNEKGKKGYLSPKILNVLGIVIIIGVFSFYWLESKYLKKCFSLPKRYKKLVSFIYPPYFFGLEELKKLPSSLTVATTELGEVGVALLPNKIIDLSGLNNRYFAFHGFKADYLFKNYSLDWIYWPLPFYKNSINKHILNNQTFRKNWELYNPPDKRQAKVAINKKSNYYLHLKAILLKEKYKKNQLEIR